MSNRQNLDLSSRFSRTLAFYTLVLTIVCALYGCQNPTLSEAPTQSPSDSTGGDNFADNQNTSDDLNPNDTSDHLGGN